MRLEFMQKDGKVDLAAYEEIVDRCARHGVKVMGLVDYSTIPSKGKPEWSTPDYESRFAKEARNLAKHFRGRIDCWEVWNEPNFGDFRLEPEVFGNVLTHAYRAIKSVDPSIEVVMGGIAGPWSGSDDNSAKQYLEKVYHSKAAVEFRRTNGHWPFDVVADHPYAWDIAPQDFLEQSMKDNIISVMAEHGDANKPLYLTEMGWDSNPESNVKISSDGQKTLSTQAEWLAKLYDICRTAKRSDGKTAMVQRVYWFQYEFSGFGLRDSGWKKRPCWDAYHKAANTKQ
jgi:hypothetical protein